MPAQEILLLVLGWLLGLLSPAVVDAIKHRRDSTQGRAAIFSELDDLATVLTLASLKATQASGETDRTHLEWLIARIREFPDTSNYAEMLASINAVLTLTDEQMAEANGWIAQNINSSPALQIYPAPLLDSRVSALWTFDTDLQRKLLTIKRNLSILDGTVLQLREYFRMTFGDLNPANREIVDANMRQLYENYAERARIIVDQVRELPRAGSNNSFKPNPLRGSA
ncbi:hypothetical protein VDS41_21695 [Xanthomonas campestris pv. campestris]|nr:hypothetical protein [Xanthomonas campestris pv. campestris]